MPVLTEQPGMGDVLKYEVNPNYTREVITLLIGMPYSPRRGRADTRQRGMRGMRRQASPLGRRCDRGTGIRPRPLAIILEAMADNGSTS